MILIICLTLSVIFGVKTALSQDDKPDPQITKKILVGDLKVHVEPKGSKVWINDNFLGYTPVKLDDLPVGEYEITVKHKNFAGFRTRVTIQAGRESLVKAKLSGQVYQSWMTNYGSAITSSMLIPGKGQVDNRKSRGWYYLISYAATMGFTYYNNFAYHRGHERFDSAYRSYKEETTETKIEDRWAMVLVRQNEMGKYKDRYEIGLIIGSAIWVVNMIDVIFFTIDEPIIFQDWHSSLFLDPGIFQNKIGIQIRF